MDEAEWKRSKAAHRLRILEAMLAAIDEWPAVYERVSRCASHAEAIEALGRDPFDFDPEQAVYVLDTPLRKCVGDARQAMVEEAARFRQHLDEPTTP